MICYKLTDARMRTHGGYQWTLGEKRTTDGAGGLCGPGFLHFYLDPYLAILLAPLHVNFGSGARLFRAKAGGAIKHDRGLKAGASELTLLEEIPLPNPTLKQRAAFAKLCAKWANEAARGPRMASTAIGAKLAELAREAMQ
jgi:hypothetical protein